MMGKCILGLFISLLGLVACQPQVVVVEVTPAAQSAAPAFALTASPVAATAEPVEVTRVVTELVTRVVTQEVMVEVTKAPLGTADRPAQLLFAPTVNTTVITGRGQHLVEALTAATGLNYEIGILDNEEGVIELMCAAPGDTIGFLSAVGYVLAHEQCGVQSAVVAVGPEGFTWQAGMIVTRRDSGINALADLAGKRWAIPDTTSIPNTLFFQAQLAEAGVETAEVVPVQGDTSAMLAVLNGEVDFATATYVPPIMPYEERLWEYGVDSPEVWRLLGVAPSRSRIGYVFVFGEPQYGGYRIRDARAGVFDIAPEIFNETRILALSQPIPNDTVAFGADFPLALARTVTALLPQFAASPACIESLCATDFYGWTGLQPVDDSFYEPLRFLIQTLDLSEEEVLSLAQ